MFQLQFLLPPRFPSLPFRHFHNYCTFSTKLSATAKMNHDATQLPHSRKRVSFRQCKVSSWTTELLEIESNNPKLHALFIPGNPGIVSFYKDFLESLFELLGGTASIRAIGHIAHTRKNWERGKLFSLQEQIDHKESDWNLTNCWTLYWILHTLRRSPEKVIYNIGLYPFLMLNPESEKQTTISRVVESSILSSLLSFGVASLGLIPKSAQRLIVSNSIGISWSGTAVGATCSHLLQYHTFRNMLFMALTEFRKLSEAPDWTFIRENQGKMAFLFGIDDHWGPLQMYEEISREVPGIELSSEREGHTHSFCCTEAGSLWVVQHVANLIKNQVTISIQ